MGKIEEYFKWKEAAKDMLSENAKLFCCDRCDMYKTLDQFPLTKGKRSHRSVCKQCVIDDVQTIAQLEEQERSEVEAQKQDRLEAVRAERIADK